MRKVFVAATVALLLALPLGLSGCGKEKPTDKAEPKPLTISVNSWVGWGPLFIAKEKGFFDGLDVDIRFVEDTGARRTGMIAGQVDGYASSVDNLAIDATFGVHGKTVMCFDESAGGDGIVAKSEVTWENLKGRKVAVQKGLPGHFLLLHVLSKHGLKPSAVDLLDLDADKAGNAFLAGTVGVAVTWEPWISKAAELKGSKVLVTTKELPALIVDTLVVRDPVLQARPQDVRKLIQGWFKALEWYEANPEDGNRIIGAAYKLKPEEVKDMVSGVRFYDLKRNRDFMGTPEKHGPIYGLFEGASQLWKEAGVVNETVGAERYIDGSFLNN